MTLKRNLLPLFLLAACCIIPIFAQNTADRPQPFPMTLILSSDKDRDQKGTMSKVIAVGKSQALLTIKQNVAADLLSKVSLSGKNVNGKKWTVNFDADQLWIGFKIYAADFDKNGVRDLLFIDYTSSTGFLAHIIMQFVMFDREGSPIPFFIPTNGSENNIVNLNAYGRANLVFSHYNYGSDGDKWHGYYITDVYEAKNGYWASLTKVNGRKLPIYTSYEGWPPPYKLLPVSVKPPVGQDIFSPKYTNDKPSFQKAGFSPLLLHNDDYCYFRKTVIVHNSASERRISFVDLKNKKVRHLLNTATRIKAFGQCEPNKQSPYLLWIN